jgi:hypothetical protein
MVRVQKFARNHSHHGVRHQQASADTKTTPALCARGSCLLKRGSASLLARGRQGVETVLGEISPMSKWNCQRLTSRR